MKLSESKEIIEYCMNKPCAYESRPFGEYPICYRVGGKIFAQFSPQENWFKITLKTSKEAGEFYRAAYPEVVVRGYHCPASQQPYWNTIDLYQFEKDALFQMIDQAYDEVVLKLTKKEQRKLPVIAEYNFVKTDGTNVDFINLCSELDNFLFEEVGGEKQREQYDQYNKLDSIHDVILVYHNGECVGCGSYKFYDEETVELKRIFIKKSERSLGLGLELVRRLEADARIAGFRYAVLETGEVLTDAIKLYKKMKYKIVPNYGQYIGMEESICMSKKI